MEFTTALVVAFAAAAPVFGQTAAPYANTTSVVTRTVTAYETYCPQPTTFTQGTKTYTATKEGWVTVKHCPKKCTITYTPSKPTVMPIGEKPKYNNGTVPACPCPKGKTECPCAPKPNGQVPGTNGTTPGGNGTPGNPGNPGKPGNTGSTGNPGTPGTSGSNPSGNTPGSNANPGSNGGNNGGNNGENNGGNNGGVNGADNHGPTISTSAASAASAASTLSSGALLGLAAIAVYML
ncbi:hypothetical protein BKA64DRAFT_640364 [Cadophora sp. MPI-SDFR-AT-0126]|nr:hypothetical protein BKA64DRAFT_640364 [Leotiomycetes sp. MPI-SDFR-AT-0126]